MADLSKLLPGNVQGKGMPAPPTKPAAPPKGKGKGKVKSKVPPFVKKAGRGK